MIMDTDALEKDINNMKCWIFRIAERKWGKSTEELAKIFDENKLYECIDEGYDYFHLMSYEHVADELRSMLESRGVVV